MKKVLLIFCLLLSFVVVNAEECNYRLHTKYVTNAEYITYDNNYSKSTKKYTVNIYNMISGLYVSYNGKNYYSDNEDTITIDNVKEGTRMAIYVYANDGCSSQVKTIYINEPYYNIYYGSQLCNGYEGKITQCTSKFLSYEPSEEITKKAIYNYENEIIQDKEEEEEEKTFIDYLKVIRDFSLNWGIKILLVVLSIIFTYIICDHKFNKIKHGV